MRWVEGREKTAGRVHANRRLVDMAETDDTAVGGDAVGCCVGTYTNAVGENECPSTWYEGPSKYKISGLKEKESFRNMLCWKMITRSSNGAWLFNITKMSERWSTS